MALPTAQKLIVVAAILHNICIEEEDVDVQADLDLPIGAEKDSRLCDQDNVVNDSPPRISALKRRIYNGESSSGEVTKQIKCWYLL